MQAESKHQTLGNPHKGKPEKNKLLKFHGSQNYFLFVYGWGNLVYFKQILSALRYLTFTFLPFKHSEHLILLHLNYSSDIKILLAMYIHQSKSEWAHWHLMKVVSDDKIWLFYFTILPQIFLSWNIQVCKKCTYKTVFRRHTANKN